MSKKLLVFTSTFPRWRDDTVPPFVYELSRRLVGRFDVHVRAPHAPGAKRQEIMDGMHVERFRYLPDRCETLASGGGILPTLSRNKWAYLQIPFFMAAEVAALRRAVSRLRPATVHAHWLIPQGFAAALLGLNRVTNVVVTTHGSDVLALSGGIARHLQKWVLGRVGRVTVVSTEMQSAVRAIDARVPVDVLPMGVDAHLFHPSQASPELREKYGVRGPLLLFVGRLVESKGVQYLLDAMPGILRRFPAAKLLLIGDGPAEAALRAQVATLGLQSHVIFLGALPNAELPAYYATADVFVGPSVGHEGLGLTFVEAGLAGCVLIGTRVGGIPDVITHGQTGFLIEPRDPDAIAEQVNAVLADERLKRTLQHAVRSRLQDRFDWDVVTRRYAEVLDQSRFEEVGASSSWRRGRNE